MKISKKRIIEIIKEEIERDLAGSESDLQVKLRDLSTAIRDEDVKIEPAEAEQVDAMITRILTVASMDNVSTADLKKANDSIQKYLNVDALTEEVLDEAASATNANAGVRRDFNTAKKNNLWDRFIEKYKDDKTPYSLYGQLDPTAQEQYKEYIQTRLKLAQAAIKVQQASEQAETPEEEQQVQQAAEKVQQAIDNAEQPSDSNNDAEEALRTAINNLNQAQDFEIFKDEYVAALTAAQELNPEKYTSAFIEQLIQNLNSLYDDLDPAKAEELSQYIRRSISGLRQSKDENKLTAHHRKFIELLKNKGKEQPTPPNITPEILRDLVVKFADMLKSNNLLSEGIGDIVKVLDIKDTKKFGALLGKTFTRDEIKMIDGIFQSDLKDTFVDLVRKAATPEASEETPQPEEDQPQAEELPSGEKAIVAALPELQDAFAKFSNDDSGFMKVGYLKDQDAMLGDLRSALRKFIGLEGLEAALTVQEEQTPDAPPPEDKTKGARQKLVKDVGRYRRDLNDTGNILAQYLKAAKAGRFKAQPILNKLKVELQRVQDNNVVIVRDLKSVAGLKENLLTEEETRDEKIANVRRAYDAIVGLLRPTLQIRTTEPEETTTTTSMQDSEEGDAVEEIMLEDIFLEQTGPTEEELQSLVDAVKQSLEQIDSIKKYFRVTGTFNRPLDELQTDFLEYVNLYKKTMSDLVADLRQGVPSPENATQYAKDFARLAEQIKEDFGVSPSEPIKVAGVPAVQPEGAADETAAVNDSPEAAEVEQTTVAPEVSSEPEEGDVSPESVQQDVDTFVKKSAKFLRDILVPLSSALAGENPNKEDIIRVKKELADLTRQKLVEEQEETEELSDLVNQVQAAKDLITDILIFFKAEKILEIKDDLKKAIKIYNGMYKKLVTVYDKPLETFIDQLSVLDQKVQADIEALKSPIKRVYQTNKEDINQNTPFKNEFITFVSGDLPKEEDNRLTRARLNQIKNLGNFDNEEGNNVSIKPDAAPTASLQENLLERLIKEELKVLNGKKMVRN